MAADITVQSLPPMMHTEGLWGWMERGKNKGGPVDPAHVQGSGQKKDKRDIFVQGVQSVRQQLGAYISRQVFKSNQEAIVFVRLAVLSVIWENQGMSSTFYQFISPFNGPFSLYEEHMSGHAGDFVKCIVEIFYGAQTVHFADHSNRPLVDGPFNFLDRLLESWNHSSKSMVGAQFTRPFAEFFEAVKQKMYQFYESYTRALQSGMNMSVEDYNKAVSQFVVWFPENKFGPLAFRITSDSQAPPPAQHLGLMRYSALTYIDGLNKKDRPIPNSGSNWGSGGQSSFQYRNLEARVVRVEQMLQQMLQQLAQLQQSAYHTQAGPYTVSAPHAASHASHSQQQYQSTYQQARRQAEQQEPDQDSTYQQARQQAEQQPPDQRRHSAEFSEAPSNPNTASNWSEPEPGQPSWIDPDLFEQQPNPTPQPNPTDLFEQQPNRTPQPTALSNASSIYHVL